MIVAIPAAAVALWIAVDQLRESAVREGPVVTTTTTPGTFYLGREALIHLEDGRTTVPVSTFLASRLRKGDRLRLEVSPTFESVRAVTLLREGEAPVREGGTQRAVLWFRFALSLLPLLLFVERRVELGMTVTLLLTLAAVMQVGYGVLHLFPSLDTAGHP